MSGSYEKLSDLSYVNHPVPKVDPGHRKGCVYQ